MKKRVKEKRKKLVTNTYMREAIDYQIVVIKENIDYYVTIKKYDKISTPFILKDVNNNEVKHIDNGSYIVEITPMNENYNIRYYISKDKKIIDFYVDITLENGVQDKVPYYIDLYLDILNYPVRKEVEFTDEDELEEALKNKEISKRDYNLAYKVGNSLLNEIRENKNKYLNIDVISIINRYFK